MRLARGDSQSVVAVIGGEFVKRLPLLRGHHAAGNAAANHHDVFLAGLAQVAVVLLIGAVKFQEFIVVLRKMIRSFVGKRRGNGARDRRDGGLDFFVVRQFGFCVIAHRRILNLTGRVRLFKSSRRNESLQPERRAEQN